MMRLLILTRDTCNTSAIKFVHQLLKAGVKIQKIIVEVPPSTPSPKPPRRLGRYIPTPSRFYSVCYRLYSRTCNSVEEDALDLHPTLLSFAEIRDDIVEVDDHNSPQVQEMIRRLSPDIILVIGTRILKEETYCPAKVAITFHSGIVPKYKGAYTVFWAMRNGDFDNVGYTFVSLAAKVDGGSVIYQERIRPDKKDNEKSAFKKIENAGSRRIVSLVQEIAENGYELRSRPQLKEGCTFKGRPSAKDWFILTLRLIQRRVRAAA